MNPIRVEQGSPEWFALRAGKVTASRIVDVMAKGKGGAEAASRANYKLELVTEILSGLPCDDTYTNAAMKWGTENEPFARAEYELMTGSMVDEVGFFCHPTIERAGASPDGVIGQCGLLEIKCPNTKTHIATLLEDEVPSKYANNQIQWQMACAGPDFRFCDFVSFDPRLPDNLKIYTKTVLRDNDRISEIEAEVVKFLAEVEATVKQLRGR